MGFVLIISDYHIGSSWAPFPERFRTSYGNILALNSGQKYLNQCHETMMASIPEEIDVLVINGDIMDGDNKFEMCRGLSEVDPLWQVKAADQFLRPLVDRAKHVRMTTGSTYHVGKGKVYSELLAERFGAKEDKRGHHASVWWRFKYKDVYFDVAHRQSTTIRYQSMPMEREVDFALERFAKKRKSFPEYMAIIRSHTHWGYGLWQERGIWSISTPSMKLQDDYAKGCISPNRIIPDNLGVVGIRVYDEPIDGRKMDVIPYLYNHPEEGDVDVIDS